ncbi:MAG: lipopolysaccharide biosynthesis protein, partial [Anaerolineae bacterium]
LSFYFIARAIIQFPGFFAVFRLFFRALQRLDYEQLLVLLLSLAPLAFQTVAILLLRRWGGARTGVGEALGSVFGLGLGLYLTEGLVFLVGLLLYRRLGFALWPLFRPTFDRRIAGRMLSFGLRMALGSLVVPVAYFVQAALLSGFLPDYGEVGGAWSIALSLFPVYEVLAIGLYNGLMPAVAAAFTQGYRTLTRYYASQGLRYGMWFSLFFLATAGALGDRFVLGLLGERYAGAAEMVGPLLIWGALQWLPWSAEAVLVGVGRPALRSALLVSEYLVRFGLLLIVRLEYGIWGLVAAFALASLLRGLLGWLLVQRLVVNVRLPFWQMAVAPAGAALVVYNLLRGVGDIYWQPDVGVTLIFSILVLLPALPLYGFFTAFLGGWDDEGLAELRRAVAISGLGIPLGRLLYEAVHLGARLSPLHGLFSHQLYRWADEEAEALTLRRPVIR